MLVRAVLRSYLRVRSHFLPVRLFHTFTLLFFIHLFGYLKITNKQNNNESFNPQLSQPDEYPL